MNREPKQQFSENTASPMDYIYEQVRRNFGHGVVINGGFDFILPPNSEPFDVEKDAEKNTEAHRALLRLLDAENDIDK